MSFLGNCESGLTVAFPKVAVALEQVCVPEGSTLKEVNDKIGIDYPPKILIKICVCTRTCLYSGN